MKAIMLAAGIGRRLYGDGGDQPPKALLSFGGKTLLRRHIEVLRPAGVEELTMVVGYRKEDVLAEAELVAGADFVKTSTGKESVNATLPVGIVLARAIRDYQRITGVRVGLKAAGGLKTARDALSWLILVKEELGDAWMGPRLFRIGASSLLADIERQLEHHVTGRYSAFHRHSLG